MIDNFPPYVFVIARIYCILVILLMTKKIYLLIEVHINIINTI